MVGNRPARRREIAMLGSMGTILRGKLLDGGILEGWLTSAMSYFQISNEAPGRETVSTGMSQPPFLFDDFPRLRDIDTEIMAMLFEHRQ